MRALALSGALVLAGGCLDALEPDVGPAQRACATDDSDPDTAVSFATDLVPIIADRCARCHDPDRDDPIGVSRGGLDLSSYAGLRAGGVESGADLVIGGDVCASILPYKLADAPPFGARMPLNSQALPDRELDLIRDWIIEGALDN